MTSAVPTHVHEPDQVVTFRRTHPSEAVPLDLTLLVVITTLVVEGLRVQRFQVCAVESATPFVIDCHTVKVSLPPECRSERSETH